MIYSGISVKGSLHDVNQDSYLCKPYKDGYIIVVSDGVGSLPLSHFGSRCICECVYDVISNYPCSLDDVPFEDVICSCHEEWKKRLSDYDIDKCGATLLTAVITGNKIRAARLGDGFLAVYTDDMIFCLYDDKSEHYQNETDALGAELYKDRIEAALLDGGELRGVLACTDGLNDIGDTEGFTRAFIDEYSVRELTEAIEEIKGWLGEWDSSDDKTLAFIMKGDRVNE